ncbi:MAG: crotonase/enoyl-CoA hydratase family protein [Myxococcota bacterium]|nr:crotonase/enoyl-CoA hydratase family protein [Myxococcota bacterium]
MTQYKSLTVEISDHIAAVTLIGPGRGNAMGPDFWAEMAPAFAALDRDDSVRVVLLRGSGKHFSYGLDLMGMMGVLGQHIMGPKMADDRAKLLTMINEMQQAVTAVADCRKPVIAAIDGWCIGGGLDLVAACDVRICSAAAKFSLREIRLAIVADIGSLQRLPPIIGQGHTRQLAFTGEDIDAERALSIGLVNDVYPDAEALHTAARAMATRIAASSPVTVRGIKQVLDYCADKSIKDGLQYVALWNTAFLQSDDLAEAISAFMERREPVF